MGKELDRLYIVTLLILNYIEYTIQNSELGESQAGIKISRRNINNLRYADDTTLMTENEEELKSLLMRVKEETGKKKTGLNLDIQNMNIMTSRPITHDKKKEKKWKQ